MLECHDPRFAIFLFFSHLHPIIQTYMHMDFICLRMITSALCQLYYHCSYISMLRHIRLLALGMGD